MDPVDQDQEWEPEGVLASPPPFVWWAKPFVYIGLPILMFLTKLSIRAHRFHCRLAGHMYKSEKYFTIEDHKFVTVDGQACMRCGDPDPETQKRIGKWEHN